MSRLVRLATASVVISVLLLVPGRPADAHQGASVVQFTFTTTASSWSFSIPSAGTICLHVGPGTIGVNCAMHFSGTYTPVAAIPCGPSTGQGNGTYSSVDSHLYSVTWVTTAGNVLPMQGPRISMLLRVEPCFGSTSSQLATGVATFS